MPDFFREQKKQIDSNLKRRLRSAAKDLSRTGRWGKDVCRRLEEFSLSGKTLRGGLVLLSYNLYGGKTDGLQNALDTAVAVELAQSSFLIHDDIMDRDAKRRGKSSFFYQYKELGDRLRFRDAYHFGESLGICAGDAGFFLGYGLLSGLRASPDRVNKMTALFSRELGYVALAQMQDVFTGYLKKSPDEASILKVYLYKTGRYTFSLPLMLGAMLAGAEEKEIATLAKIGEKLGILFQIKDDELGLFGDEKQLGKPIGSDIRENKKNLYHYHLYKAGGPAEKRKLDAIFGNADIRKEDVETVRRIVDEKGIRERMNGLGMKLAKDAEKLIGSLKHAKREFLPVLAELLLYSTNRSR